jgi:YVTN family beta-propeller protein
MRLARTIGFGGRLASDTSGVVMLMRGGVCPGGRDGLPSRLGRVVAFAIIVLIGFTANAVAGVTAYVVSGLDGTVTPLATDTGTPGTPIPVGLAPEGIAITPDGRTVYVTTQAGRVGMVTPIATATNSAGTPIPVPGLARGWIAITPDGKTAYVASEDSDAVTPITVATNTPGNPIPVGSAPLGIAITPDGKTAYVANQSSASVTPISLATNTPETPIPVGPNPTAIAIAPNGATAYVAESGTAVTPIAIPTGTPGPSIALTGPDCFSGSGPGSGIAITPDGATAYVVNGCSGTVTPITLATDTPGAPIPADGFGIAITPDGATVYVTNFEGAVTPLAVATNTLGNPITFGEGLLTIAITPARRTVTSLSCSPSRTVVGRRTTCITTVHDIAGRFPITPTGTVAFATDGSGTFAGSPCTLSGRRGVASCQVGYTPSAVGTFGEDERHTITATYVGDSSHAGSMGQTSLAVQARPTLTMVACRPTSGVGRPRRCTAKVTDTGRGQPITPTGTVAFGGGRSPRHDIFTGSPCVLSGTGTGTGARASCTVLDSKSSIAPGRHAIFAYYSGDLAHHPSRVRTTITGRR